MISQRQIKLLESLKNDDGKIPSQLKHLADGLKRFAYSESELDLIEKELNKVETWKSLVKKRETR